MSALDQNTLFWFVIALSVFAFLGGLYGMYIAFGEKKRNIQTCKDELSFYEHKDSGWLAWDDDEYTGVGSPVGKGKTEAEAIKDLMEKLNGHA